VSISLSTSLSIPPAAVPSEPATAAAASRPQPVFIPPDRVSLSETEQVYQLYNQGQRVTQIAEALSLSVSAVNSYLNLASGS
jgi:DNA-binding NarL/FixJ family response regulator